MFCYTTKLAAMRGSESAFFQTHFGCPQHLVLLVVFIKTLALKNQIRFVVQAGDSQSPPLFTTTKSDHCHRSNVAHDFVPRSIPISDLLLDRLMTHIAQHLPRVWN